MSFKFISIYPTGKFNSGITGSELTDKLILIAILDIRIDILDMRIVILDSNFITL